MTRRDDIALWDDAAAGFDEAADHGLRDPEVRAAWRELLLARLPPPPSRVADLGCGTGTLSVLLAAAGHRVDGVDFSPEMVRRARAKAGGSAAAPTGARFVVGDATAPPLGAASYDVVLCRHVLWAMPDPSAALRAWLGLLAPGGRLVLVEGRWSTGGGLGAAETVALVRAAGREASLTVLAQRQYWGREIDDERYVVVSGDPLVR
jgi:ubiquinone/menaquinone biosynthesis C-methylase UbiE